MNMMQSQPVHPHHQHQQQQQAGGAKPQYHVAGSLPNMVGGPQQNGGQMSSSLPTSMAAHPLVSAGDMMRPVHNGASPPEYAQQQQQQQQQQMVPPPHSGPPMGSPASYPWTVGSTDGAFAIVALQQQQQQHSFGTVSQLGTSPSGGGAAIGAAGEATNNLAALAAVQSGKSLYHDRLFHQPSASVESILAASCDVMGFDIAEMWLRTGPKTHQLTNSHLRPTALEGSVRKELVDVYYGDRSSERTHRLSPALCKRAKDAKDVVWVTAHTSHGAEALRCSLNNVRTAVAVPVCHEASNTNVTIIYFSIRRIIMRPTAVEFLVHMSLCAAVSAVNSLAEDSMVDRSPINQANNDPSSRSGVPISQSEHAILGEKQADRRHPRAEHTSITGARLDLQWRQLQNVEYLTDGGNSWIHTAVFNGKPVVVKTLKPECQDVALAINEIEGELDIHARLNHPNIVGLIGAGLTSKGVRFVVLERLDGGTLAQMLGYDTRIRDRRRRFWRKKQFPYQDVLRFARSMASAMQYCHEEAVPGSIVLHRDLKPDNVGFTLDGTVKILDFGLARILENSDPMSNEMYTMSGETGSLRYMAPEVAETLPYNHKADVYSFGIIFWELNAGKKPFIGLNRELYYERVVHGGERPPLNKKWPAELCKLITDCWDTEINNRPTFGRVVERLDEMLSREKEGGKKSITRRISTLIDRHSTWF